MNTPDKCRPPPKPKLRVITHLELLELPITDSPTLKRLIEEVRNGEPGDLVAYNRVHSRHNRS